MRPKKTRWVKCEPGERCFRPQCRRSGKLEGVILTLDEFEAVRLSDLDGLEQEKVTVSRIVTSAHKKIADALVNIKAIKIEGGCCKVIEKRK